MEADFYHGNLLIDRANSGNSLKNTASYKLEQYVFYGNILFKIAVSSEEFGFSKFLNTINRFIRPVISCVSSNKLI